MPTFTKFFWEDVEKCLHFWIIKGSVDYLFEEEDEEFSNFVDVVDADFVLALEGEARDVLVISLEHGLFEHNKFGKSFS